MVLNKEVSRKEYQNMQRIKICTCRFYRDGFTLVMGENVKHVTDQIEDTVNELDVHKMQTNTLRECR